MKHLLSVGLMAAALSGLGLGVAEAHPRLVSANPAPKSMVAAPSEIRLGFSETLVGRFSHLALMDSRGHVIKVGPTLLSPDGKQIAARVGPKLTPGRYRLNWQAVSTDTHHVQGSYPFAVAK